MKGVHWEVVNTISKSQKIPEPGMQFGKTFSCLYIQGGEHVRMYVFCTYVRINGTYRILCTYVRIRTLPCTYNVRLYVHYT